MTRLGRKQNIRDQQQWHASIAAAVANTDPAELDNLVSTAADAIRERAKTQRIGYGWSGGKDSQVLRYLMSLAGIETCVLGMTTGLEWPAMLRWQTDHMPLDCRVIAQPLDLYWLRDRPHMLFPQGKDGPVWFAQIQHKAQTSFVHSEAIDVLAMGRRRKEGNYTGKPCEWGGYEYTNRLGVTRWSPIADWSHEHVFALIARENLAMPPCYQWPRGYQIGSGAWPARQYTDSVDHGWSECWEIDPDVVREAATVLASGADWMQRNGLA